MIIAALTVFLTGSDWGLSSIQDKNDHGSVAQLCAKASEHGIQDLLTHESITIVEDDFGEAMRSLSLWDSGLPEKAVYFKSGYARIDGTQSGSLPFSFFWPKAERRYQALKISVRIRFPERNPNDGWAGIALEPDHAFMNPGNKYIMVFHDGIASLDEEQGGLVQTIFQKEFVPDTWYFLQIFFNAGDAFIYLDDAFIGRVDRFATIEGGSHSFFPLFMASGVPVDFGYIKVERITNGGYIPADPMPQAVFTLPSAGETPIEEVEYEGPTDIAFDSYNRPYMMHTSEGQSTGFISTLYNGDWVQRSYSEAVEDAYPGFEHFDRRRHARGRLVFDRNDNLYAIVYVRESGTTRPILLSSSDYGQSYHVHDLKAEGEFVDHAYLEKTSNPTDATPLIALTRHRASHPAPWVSYNAMWVVAPQWQDDICSLSKPVLVTEETFGLSHHSGGDSFAVTQGHKSFLVFVKIPDEKTIPFGGRNNPTYAVEFDRDANTVTKTHVVDAPPHEVNTHSTPVIAMDDAGYLHIVTGSHGQSFFHIRSQEPNTIHGGWEDEIPLKGRQTYAALVSDSNDHLHIAYREWGIKNGELHPYLSYKRKDPAEKTWSDVLRLVEPAEDISGYGIWYHRLTRDHDDALYLAFTFYQPDYDYGDKTPQRMLIVSEDAGQTWEVATTSIFERRIP